MFTGSVTLAVGDTALASEAVDEAMPLAPERWSKVGHYDRPAGWVFRVAINWATSRHRKLALRPTLSRGGSRLAHHRCGSGRRYRGASKWSPTRPLMTLAGSPRRCSAGLGSFSEHRHPLPYPPTGKARTRIGR